MLCETRRAFNLLGMETEVHFCTAEQEPCGSGKEYPGKHDMDTAYPGQPSVNHGTQILVALRLLVCK